MSDYIVSARKYRPDSFGSLIGQDNIAQTLKNSILRGQLAHAYLFCGPRGVGKTSTARIFAKTINCSDPTPDMEPCGKCESCLSFAEGRSYCIHELDAASNNGVDDIKALMDQVRIPPQVGKYSVYIIDEVHMLSQAAFNAFLKTLEEPPAHAIFILATTEKHKILPTILSRCQTYDFNRITVENIVRNLRDIATKENIRIDDESLHVIAHKADGAMRDALTIFDQTVAFCGTDVKYQDVLKNLNVLDYEHCFMLVDDFLRGDYAAALLKFDEILSKGFNALHFMAALSSHLRDLAVSKSAGLEALLDLPDSLKKRYKEQADRCSMQFLYEALNITTTCESGYRASINQRLHIEFALMRLSTLSGALAGQMTIGAQQNGQAVSAQTGTSGTLPGRDRNNGQTQPTAEGQSQQAAEPQTADKPTHQGTVQHGAGPSASAVEVQPQPTPRTESPQPAMQAQSAEETRPQQRRARPAGAALSIKAMTEEKQKQEPVAETAAPATELTEETIQEKWKELASLYNSKPRLANTISSASLEISMDGPEKKVTFKVFNSAQKDWIAEKCLRDLEGNFQRLTGSTVKLDVDVMEEQERAPVAYMPSEKARDLMDRNDEVKNLVKDFGLDIK